MILTAFYPNMFEPSNRKVSAVEWRDGMRVSDAVDTSAPGSVSWLNGGMVREGDPLLSDGDSVAVMVHPEGIFELTLLEIFQLLVVLFAVSVVLRSMVEEEGAPPAEDSKGSANNGYNGFNNSYRADGEAVPVVYGTCRVAGPAVNKTVSAGLANLVGPNQTSQFERYETLTTLFAISHGPILGIGDYKSPVTSDAEWTAAVSPASNTNSRAGIEVNGISAGHVQMSAVWRTGESTQESFGGIETGFFNSTDVGTTYPIDFLFPVATLGIAEADYPAGTVPYGDRIQTGNAASFASVGLESKSDAAVVQFLFPRGLYKGYDDGDPNPNTARFRVQYWRTDPSLTQTGATVILPEFTITGTSTNTVSVDLPFTLYDPDTYIPGAEFGHAKVESWGHKQVHSNVTSGLNLIRPGGVGLDPNLKFTFACYASLHYMIPLNAGGVFGFGPGNFTLWLWSWTNAANDMLNNDTEPGEFTGAGEAVSGAKLWVDLDVVYTYNDQGQVTSTSYGGTGDIYLSVIASEHRGSGGIAKSEWRSAYPVGNIAQTGQEPSTLYKWPAPNPADGYHFGFNYDQSNWSSTGGYGELHAFRDGIEIPMVHTIEKYGSAYTGDQVALQFRVNQSGTGVNSFQTGTLGGVNGDDGVPYQSRGALCQFLFYEGVLGQSWFYEVATTRDQRGHPTFDVASLGSDPKTLVAMRFDDDDVVNTLYYKNHAPLTAAGTTMSTGALAIQDTAYTVQSTGGTWTADSGTADSWHYVIEVFRGLPAPIESTEENSMARLDSITAYRSQDYEYPGIALLSTSINANDQVSNSQPTVSLIVHGRLVPVYDGTSDPSTPVFTTEWSSNPAWIALDALTNREYGMGDTFVHDGTWDSIDLRQFHEWAAFCEEGVPDAFGTMGLFSIKTASEASTPPSYRVTLRFGKTDTADALLQTTPNSWRVGRHVSIASIVGGGIDAGWVTADDATGGLNGVSNLMEILSITPKGDDGVGTDDGVNSYVEVVCRWNREGATTSERWPGADSLGGVVNDAYEVFAHDFGLTSLGEAGQYEVRCQFDGVFDSKSKSAWGAVIDIFQAGRAMPVKAGRRIFPVWDRPRDPVGLFTMANIVDGKFEVSYSSPEVRPNSIEVEILDRDHGYERRTVLVDHDSIQNPDVYGQVRKERIRRMGITRRSQAIRDATLRLNRNHLTRRGLKFTVGPDALHLLPGDRVLVSHDVPQYGYSGRLASGYVLGNIHPGGISLLGTPAWSGGDCDISQSSMLESAAVTMPLSAYGSGAVRAYSVPTFNSGGVQVLSGENGGDGYEDTSRWASQHVAVRGALYPTSGHVPGDPLAPLMQITRVDQSVEFSVYVREPAQGAAKQLVLNLYRLVDDDEGDVLISNNALFGWSSGVLSNSSTSGSHVTARVDAAANGWYRASIRYDNDNASGGGAGAVGDYLQARIYFSHTTGSSGTFLPVASGGRGNQFLNFGDPLNLSGWTKYNDGVGTNSIDHVASSAPPFYLDTGSDAGKRGHVVRLTMDASLASGVTPPNIVQTAALPTGSLATTWNGQKICFTMYARVSAVDTANATRVYVDLRVASTVDSNNRLNGDGVHTTIDTPSGSSWGVAGTTNYVAAGTVANVVATVAAVYQNSSTNDPDWAQIDISFDYTPNAGDLSNISVGVYTGGGTSGSESIDIWGLRLHGEGTVNGLVNPWAHTGALLWGPQVVADSVWDASSAPAAYSPGGTLELDRDVVLESGSEYEVYVRSSRSQDTVLGTDAQAKLLVAGSEVPSSGSVTKAARTSLAVSSPATFVPDEGDIYSFGKLGKAVEDMVVTNISLNAEELTREIEAVEYDAAIYVDTEFGVLGDTVVSDLAGLGNNDAAMSGMGGSGPRGGMFTLLVTPVPYRTPDGSSKPALDITWRRGPGDLPGKEVRLYISRVSLTDNSEGSPQYIGAFPNGVSSYQYASETLRSGRTYRVRAQRVGWSGTAEALNSAVVVEVRATVVSPLPPAPTVTIDFEGFKQIYTAHSNDTGRVKAIEARIGGWIISTPGFIEDPDRGKVVSDALSLTSTNAAGQTHMPVFLRNKLASGLYGPAASVTAPSTMGFKDERSVTSANAEDSFATEGVVTSDLELFSGELGWATSSTATSGVYYEMNETDLTTAQRAVATCVIRGVQVRPETLADLPFSLGSDMGKRWSIEGPMDQTGLATVDGVTIANAEVKVEWRWTSGSSLSAEVYQEYVPQEVYFRKCQFRLAFTRPTTGYNVRIKRMASKVDAVPLFDPANLDGGTF